MTGNNDEASAFFTAVQAAIDFGGPGYGEESASGFNTAGQHVLTLLKDAVAAFDRGSFGTSVFLAITALEETAKAEILAFRMRTPEGAQKKRGDPLHSHLKKHGLAVRPTTFMGRLPSILGHETCAKLQREAMDGSINRLRETAVFLSCSGDGAISTPAMTVDRTRAREIVLLALESADGILVGSTNESYQLGESIEAFIAHVS